MFKLPGSLPKSRIQHLREKCRVTVMQIVDELNQREADYRAQVELRQQQQQPQQQPQQQQQHQQQVNEPEPEKAKVEDDRTGKEKSEEGSEETGTDDQSKTTCTSNGELGSGPFLVRSTVGFPVR
ncbi:unnamed protein product [Dibothriocephalus latus]|uniref:Uncharacterized protein n=1 Tax=Dibothriocephalus latus TaxID=60516 RepID=A0A3P7L079_DIBLA|nr:unnamed protein product [Dibothriocephalus latus]